MKTNMLKFWKLLSLEISIFNLKQINRHFVRKNLFRGVLLPSCHECVPNGWYLVFTSDLRNPRRSLKKKRVVFDKYIMRFLKLWQIDLQQYGVTCEVSIYWRNVSVWNKLIESARLIFSWSVLLANYFKLFWKWKCLRGCLSATFHF